MNDGFRLEEQRFPNAGLAVSYVRNIGVIPAGLFTIQLRSMNPVAKHAAIPIIIQVIFNFFIYATVI